MAVLDFVEGKPGLVSCIHGRLEVWSAINRHVREGNLTRPQAKTVLRRLTSDENSGVWNFLAITTELIASACVAVEKLPSGVFVRSADALHLECARSHGASEIYSNDRHLLAAAAHFDLQPCNVIA